MAWFVLVVAGVLEAVWAVALGKSEGFTRLTPSVVFLIAIAASMANETSREAHREAIAASMAGLGYAMRTLPIGTAYAVWVGIGAALTVTFSMIAGDEPVSFVRVLLIGGLIGCVIGLKFAH